MQDCSAHVRPPCLIIVRSPFLLRACGRRALGHWWGRYANEVFKESQRVQRCPFSQ